MTKAERTRQFIIETTAPIFNSKGYEGTSISDITAATGLTKGSVYGNFKDKNELAAAVFDYNLEKIRSGNNCSFMYISMRKFLIKWFLMVVVHF